MTNQKKQVNRAGRGFSLAETLMALLILLLATAVAAAGLPAAVRAYHDVVDAANADVLLATTMTALRDELGSTEGFTLGAGGALDHYKSAGLQGRSAALQNSGSGITVEYGGTSRKLVSDAAATRRLHAEFTGIRYDDTKQVFVVSDLQVKRNADGKLLAEAPEEYLIRPMNPRIIENS